MRVDNGSALIGGESLARNDVEARSSHITNQEKSNSSVCGLYVMFDHSPFSSRVFEDRI